MNGLTKISYYAITQKLGYFLPDANSTLIIHLTRNSQNLRFQKDINGGWHCIGNNNARGKLLEVMKKHLLYHMTIIQISKQNILQEVFDQLTEQELQ